jgi:hypothetical protein
MNTKNLTYEEAIDEVYNDLLTLSDADFRKALDDHANGDFANILRETKALQARKESADLLDRDFNPASLALISQVVGMSSGSRAEDREISTHVFPYTYAGQVLFFEPWLGLLTGDVVDATVPCDSFPLESRSRNFIRLVTLPNVTVLGGFGGRADLSTYYTLSVPWNEGVVVLNGLTDSNVMHFTVRTEEGDEEEWAA